MKSDAALTPGAAHRVAGLPASTVDGVCLLYSVDYELFFTENHDELAVLVEPMDRLLDVADAIGIKLTIFVDTLGLFKCRENGLSTFVLAAEDQLRRAVARGHDVQTHLHPHWVTARWSNGAWEYDAERFLLGHSGNAPEVYDITVQHLVTSRQYLQDLLRPVRATYRTVAFRAGGYGLQPCEEAIIKALKDTGYLIDSSIVPGMYLRTARNQVDYRDVPTAANFFIDEVGGTKIPATRGVFEVPIAAGSIDAWAMARRLVRYARQRLTPSAPLFGTGHSGIKGDTIGESGSLLQSVARKRRVLMKRYAALRLPEDPRVLFAVTNEWIARHEHERPMFFSLLLHPKGLTSETVSDLQRYHRLLADRARRRVAYVTFQHVADTFLLNGNPLT